MKLDYSKVVMVGNGWATRGEDGELTMFATAIEAAGGESPVDAGPEPEDEPAPESTANVLAMVEYFTEYETSAKPAVKLIESELEIDTNGAEITEAWTKYKESSAA